MNILMKKIHITCSPESTVLMPLIWCSTLKNGQNVCIKYNSCVLLLMTADIILFCTPLLYERNKVRMGFIYKRMCSCCFTVPHFISQTWFVADPDWWLFAACSVSAWRGTGKVCVTDLYSSLKHLISKSNQSTCTVCRWIQAWDQV